MAAKTKSKAFKKWMIGIVSGIGALVGVAAILGGGMTELRHEIRIEASPDKVWAVLSDLEAVAHYNPGVTEAHYLSSQRAGVGAARECKLKDQSIVKERVIGLEQGKSLTMELFESPWPVTSMKWKTELQNDGNGTRVTQLLDYEPRGLFGNILNFLVMKRMMNKSIDNVFGQLKIFVEKQK